MQNFPPVALRGCAELHNLPLILRWYRLVRVFGVWVTPMKDTDKMLNALYRLFVSTGRYIIKKLSLFNELASLLSLELDAPFSMRLIWASRLAYSTAWGKPPKQTIHWGEFKLRWGGLSVSAPPFLAFFVGKKPPANVTLSPLTFGDRYVF